ncbi:MAG TPA: hypothetical protein VGE74_29660 [Gemmata sp.]
MPVIKYDSWQLDANDARVGNGEDNQFYPEWQSKGLDMLVFEGKVTAIWVFNEGADEHKRYQGQLPGALGFDDNEETIEKKLGKPEEVDNYEPRRVLGKGPLVEDRFLNYPDGRTVLLRRPKGGGGPSITSRWGAPAQMRESTTPKGGPLDAVGPR